MKATTNRLLTEAEKLGVTPSMMRRWAGKRRVTPRRAKHTRGRKPICLPSEPMGQTSLIA